MALPTVPAPWERSIEDIRRIRSLPDHEAVLNGLKDEEAEGVDPPCEHPHQHCFHCGGCNTCDRADDHDDTSDCPHGCRTCEAPHTCTQCGYEPDCDHALVCRDCEEETNDGF